VRYVALEVPLGTLPLARRGQRGDAADARIESLGDALDNAALTSGIAPLEYHDHLELVVLNPALQFHQLGLQAEQLFEVNPAVDGFSGGVAGKRVRIEPVVVDLELQFLVETVKHFRVNAVMDRPFMFHGFVGH
jgi:hypothetical protein